jgi:phytanoyl-CoA hydroxylase
MIRKKPLNIFLQINEKKRYLSNGWVKIPNLISKKEVEKLKKTIGIFLKRNKKSYDKKNVNFLLNQKNEKIVHTFHKISDSKIVKKFANQKKISNIAEKLIDDKSKFRKCELFAKPSKIGIASPPHQDNFYWCLKNGKSLTFWIALDKSNKRNGALYYYNGTHKLGLVSHVASNIKGSSQTVKDKKKLNKFKKITPSLNVGDALVHDSHIIHGSTKNNSNDDRMGLTIQFQALKCRVDSKKQKIYLNSLNKQIKNRSDARI